MDEQAAQCERDAALRKAQQLHKRCSDMNESLGLFKRDALAQKDAEAKLVGQLGAGAARLQRKHMQLKAVSRAQHRRARRVLGGGQQAPGSEARGLRMQPQRTPRLPAEQCHYRTGIGG